MLARRFSSERASGARKREHLFLCFRSLSGPFALLAREHIGKHTIVSRPLRVGRDQKRPAGSMRGGREKRMAFSFFQLALPLPSLVLLLLLPQPLLFADGPSRIRPSLSRVFASTGALAITPAIPAAQL